MYSFPTNVLIDLATYFLNMIQKAFSNKESSFPCRGLITRVVILGKVPLKDVKPIAKMFDKGFT